MSIYEKIEEIFYHKIIYVKIQNFVCQRVIIATWKFVQGPACVSQCGVTKSLRSRSSFLWPSLLLIFKNVFLSKCRDAAMMSMRRKIAGLRPDQIKQIPREELDLPVSAQDFRDALAKCNKSVSKEDLDKYEKWMKEFGSTWWRCKDSP